MGFSIWAASEAGVAYLLLLITLCVWLLLQWRWSKCSAVCLPPGPVTVPLFGHWLQVGDHITGKRMAKLAKQYGDIFLLKMGRRNLVVLHSPDLAQEMLHTHGVSFGSRASNVVLDIFSGAGQGLSFAEYGEHWRKARRIVTLPFFTSEAVRRWKSTWAAEADMMVESLGGRSGAFTEGVELRGLLQLMMYNNLYSVAFGRRFATEEDPLYAEMKGLNDERNRLMQNLDYNYGDFHAIFYPLVRGYLQACRRVKEDRELLFKHFISEYTKQRMSLEAKETFGIEHLLAAVEHGEMREENILYMLENLNSAGIPTIRSTIEWTIAELVNNPHIQAKLYEELCSNVVGSEGRELKETWPLDCKLPYLQAVLKETMRLHTIVPLIVPHMNLKPAKLGGYDIPARSKVIVNAWWLANNPEWWSRPEEFRPERFLGEEESVEMKGNNFKFLPFGSGRRQCPGIAMALPVIRLAIGKLVLKFELLPPPCKSLDMSEQHGQLLLEMAVPPRVVLMTRQERKVS